MSNTINFHADADEDKEKGRSGGLFPPVSVLPAPGSAGARAGRSSTSISISKASSSKKLKKPGPGTGQPANRTPKELPTTEQALPFYGIQEGVVSLRGGGTTILVEFDGFDFDTAGASAINNLGVVLSEATAAVCKVNGKLSSGVSVSYTLLQRRLDLTSFIAANRKAAQRVDETGIAAFARNEEEYLRYLSAKHPFVQRRNFISITLDKAAYQAELYQAEEEKLAQVELDDEIATDAAFYLETIGKGKGPSSLLLEPLELASESREGGEEGGEETNQGRSNSESRKKARAGRERGLLEKIKRNWQDTFGGGSAARNVFAGSASGIQLNPVAPQAITSLNQKAEIIIAALRQVGLAGWVLSSVGAAEVLAQMLAMPIHSTVPLEQALERELKAARSKRTKSKPKPGFPQLSFGLGQGVIRTHTNHSVASRANRVREREREQKDAPKISLFGTNGPNKGSLNQSISSGSGGSRYGPSSNDWGTIDSSSFSYVPLSFQPRYIRVGQPPELAYAIDRFRRAVGQRYYQKTTRQGKNTFLLGVEVADDGGGTEAGGTLYQQPVASYLTTLYSTGWPRQLTMGSLFPLVTAENIEMVVTVQLVPLPKRKAQGKLERQRTQLELAQDTDNSTKAWYERKELLETIEDLNHQIVSDEGGIILAGLRVAVRADSLPSLYKQTGQVSSLLSGVGISMTPALYNQALAFYSTLPLGRDFIRTAPLFGKRTIRNMSSFVSSCLFPSLIPEQAAESGVFIGRGSYGGITCINTEKLLAPHGLTYGASGAGKTVSKQIDISRRLTANPNLSVVYIDPQGVLDRLAYEMAGVVLDMSSEADKKVRLNFLDRYIMGGRPIPFADLTTIFTTFVTIMQGQTLAPNEKSAILNALKRLIRHFESGDNISGHLIAGLRARFSSSLELALPGRAEHLQAELEKCYNRLRPRHNVPTHGYVMQVVSEQGRPKLHFSCPEYERQWQLLRARTRVRTQAQSPVNGEAEPVATNPNSNNLSEAELVADAAIELAILKTYVAENRNYYDGQGEVRVQIPFAVYDRIQREVNTRKAGGPLDRSAWLWASLLRYLCSDQPRRVVLDPPVTPPASPVSGSGSVSGSGETPQLHQQSRRVSAWVSPPTYQDSRGYERFAANSAQSVLGEQDPAMLSALRSQFAREGLSEAEIATELGYHLGTHLVVDGGPCWYADEAWSERVGNDFAVWFGESHFFDKLTDEEVPIVLRDLMLGLRYGIPILSDLLPVLAAEPYAYDLVRNLESGYCDMDGNGDLFNGHTNVDIYNRFIVFNVKNVSPELRPLRMMQALQLSWRLITSQAATLTQLKEYLLVMDEFGIFANEAPDAATYWGVLYKRTRAFGCTMWLIDQDASSLQSQAGRYAMSNVGVVEIMRQDQQDLAYWQQMFGLSEEEVDIIANFGPGEVFIILNEPGRKRKIQARYTMSEGMHRILSTKQADVKRYIAEQQVARGVKGDKLAEMMENLLGHNFGFGGEGA